MSTESPPQPKPRPSPAAAKGRTANAPGGASWGLRLFDVALIGLFLALAFLLGVFPLKDADFYWHLRTGDLIRETGEIPRVDFYTFTRAGTPWIDLHWMFQVGVSWINERGGVPALTLAKALITALAVFLLITARRRDWPIWAMVLAWIPALLVLSGPDVRPARDAQPPLSGGLPGRALPMGSAPRAGLALAVRAGGVGQLARAVRPRADPPGRSRLIDAALGRGAFAPEPEAMVEDRRVGVGRDRPGLPAQPVRDSRRDLIRSSWPGR